MIEIKCHVYYKVLYSRAVWKAQVRCLVCDVCLCFCSMIGYKILNAASSIESTWWSLSPPVRLCVGFIQSWHQQLHQKGWCPLSSSLWRLLTEPLWHSSSPPSKPTVLQPETSSTLLYDRVTTSPPSGIRKRTTHSLSLMPVWTAKAGHMRGPRAELLTLWAQNLPNLDPAEESCKRTTEVLQVFMTKSIFHLCSSLFGTGQLSSPEIYSEIDPNWHVTDAIRPSLTFVSCLGPVLQQLQLFLNHLLRWWDCFPDLYCKTMIKVSIKVYKTLYDSRESCV